MLEYCGAARLAGASECGRALVRSSGSSQTQRQTCSLPATENMHPDQRWLSAKPPNPVGDGPVHHCGFLYHAHSPQLIMQRGVSTVTWLVKACRTELIQLPR